MPLIRYLGTFAAITAGHELWLPGEVRAVTPTEAEALLRSPSHFASVPAPASAIRSPRRRRTTLPGSPEPIKE